MDDNSSDRDLADDRVIEPERDFMAEWASDQDGSFRLNQILQERRKIRNQVIRDSETRHGIVRCKCGTIMDRSRGKGPHKARADCPVCKRWVWVESEKSEFQEPCDWCDGSGHSNSPIGVVRCGLCKGTGKKQPKKRRRRP